MKKITVKTGVNRYGIMSTTYKDGRKKLAEILYKSNGIYTVYCAFHNGNFMGFDYQDLDRATERTRAYITNLFAPFGCDVVFI
jgi:hypothetical protein